MPRLERESVKIRAAQIKAALGTTQLATVLLEPGGAVWTISRGIFSWGGGIFLFFPNGSVGLFAVHSCALCEPVASHATNFIDLMGNRAMANLASETGF